MSLYISCEGGKVRRRVSAPSAGTRVPLAHGDRPLCADDRDWVLAQGMGRVIDPTTESRPAWVRNLADNAKDLTGRVYA